MKTSNVIFERSLSENMKTTRDDVTLCPKCGTADTRKCGTHDVVVDCSCGAVGEKVMSFRVIRRQIRVMEREM